MLGQEVADQGDARSREVGSGAGGAGRGLGKAQGERRQTGLPPSGLPPSCHPRVPPAGMCPCKEERAPTHACPWTPGLRACSATSLGLSPLPVPLHSVACFLGLVSAEGQGAIALYILETLRGKEGGPDSPLTVLSAPPRGSPSLSPNVLLRGPHLKPCPQPQNPRQPSQPRSLAGTPTPWGAAHARIRESAVCAGASGASGGQAWVFHPKSL